MSRVAKRYSLQVFKMTICHWCAQQANEIVSFKSKTVFEILIYAEKHRWALLRLTRVNTFKPVTMFAMF